MNLFKMVLGIEILKLDIKLKRAGHCLQVPNLILNLLINFLQPLVPSYRIF